MGQRWTWRRGGGGVVVSLIMDTEYCIALCQINLRRCDDHKYNSGWLWRRKVLPSCFLNAERHRPALLNNYVGTDGLTHRGFRGKRIKLPLRKMGGEATKLAPRPPKRKTLSTHFSPGVLNDAPLIFQRLTTFKLRSIARMSKTVTITKQLLKSLL